MNKLLGALALSLTVSMTTFAQDNKEQLIDKIEQSNVWMTGYVVEKLFTINLSPTMWEAVLAAPNDPRGRDAYKQMAQSIVDFSDKAGYTSLNEKCGFGVQSDKMKEYKSTCQEQIDGLSKKITLKIDAPTIAKNPDSFKLTLGYMARVGDFLGSRSKYIADGWRPKGEKLNIIISPSATATGIKVAWSTDGQTVTVSGPANKEVAGWSDAILEGMAKGGKK